MLLHYILFSLPPPLFSLFPLPPFLEQCQFASFFYFHMWVQNTSTMFTLVPPFLVPTHLPLVLIPRKDLFFILLLFICLKIYIDSPRGVCLSTSGLYISCFNPINLPTCYLLVIQAI
jgi:hypothetical protein